MIPPRRVPPGILQLYQEDSEGVKTLVQELPTSSKNRQRLQNMRNDMLMVNPTAKLIISENNALN